MSALIVASTLPCAAPVYLCLNGARFSKRISRSKAPIARTVDTEALDTLIAEIDALRSEAASKVPASP